MEQLETLGFRWDRSALPTTLPARPMEQVPTTLRERLAVYVWDAGVLEDNPLTFTEVELLLDGDSLDGKKPSDKAQILNLAESTQRLITMVEDGQFSLTKATFTELHAIVAREEALEWGRFRGEGPETHYTPNVGLGEQGRYTPLPTKPGASELNRVFEEGVSMLEEQCPPLERGLAFFLFGALQQFLFDGNKRTSRLIMNGVLMSHGIDAISIPAARVQAFNEKMVNFYLSRDGTEMMGFLLDCHPGFNFDSSNRRASNARLSQ